jgi:hypothetical protein
MVLRVLLLFCLFCPSAFAELGGNGDAPERDRAILHGVRMSTAKANYTVQEITYAGTKLREFVDGNNKVFGVAWSGMTHPNMALVLGKYWKEQNAKMTELKHNMGKRRQHVTTQNIVFETGGHMREVNGRAYLPASLPVGFSLEDLQ